jgi:hypothetical protein
LKRCHLAPAPSCCLARAVGGKVISRQLVEVAQAPVGRKSEQSSSASDSFRAISTAMSSSGVSAET